MAAIFLETQICYDWDDYNVWADVYFDTDTGSIEVTKYGHGAGCAVEGVNHKDTDGEYDAAILQAFANKFSVSHISYDLEKRMADGRFLGIPCKDGIVATKKTIFKKGKIMSRSLDKALDDISHKAIGEASHRLIAEGKFSISWLAHIVAYGISYSACDTRNKARCLDDICMAAIQTFTKPEGYDVALEAFSQRRAEINARRPRPAEDKKRKELEEWAARKLAGESEEYRQRCIEKALARWREERKMRYEVMYGRF